MVWVKSSKDGSLPESSATPEEVYINRREFLRQLGGAGARILALSAAPSLLGAARLWAETPGNSGLKISPENLSTGYNNYYEFSGDPAKVASLARGLKTDEWTIRVEGLVKKPRVLDWDRLVKRFSMEERVYKLRCVETWTATIPWTGFPVGDLIRALDPAPSARYVAFKTFVDPVAAPGQKKRFWEPWPYVEGLRLDEALHDLSFLATGMYGKPLSPQNGAPVRLVVPWKYGFKSAKAIAEIEFTREPPATFWQTVSPLEYDFWANVIPGRPYARWDQSWEYALGEKERTRTRPFNGYAREVAGLYS